MVNQMVRSMATGDDASAKVISGAVTIIDWILSKDQFAGDALKVLGLLEIDKEPYQDYMSRDSDTNGEKD